MMITVWKFMKGIGFAGSDYPVCLCEVMKINRTAL
jgi:hypothetical protein